MQSLGCFTGTTEVSLYKRSFTCYKASEISWQNIATLQNGLRSDGIVVNEKQQNFSTEWTGLPGIEFEAMNTNWDALWQ